MFECQDRGRLITDNNIDIWLSSNDDAWEFGVRQARAVVWAPIGGMTERDRFEDIIR